MPTCRTHSTPPLLGSRLEPAPLSPQATSPSPPTTHPYCTYIIAFRASVTTYVPASAGGNYTITTNPTHTPPPATTIRVHALLEPLLRCLHRLVLPSTLIPPPPLSRWRIDFATRDQSSASFFLYQFPAQSMIFWATEYVLSFSFFAPLLSSFSSLPSSSSICASPGCLIHPVCARSVSASLAAASPPTSKTPVCSLGAHARFVSLRALVPGSSAP
ncbi:hypothetical protein B0H19DRAFT_1378969 [Mycena capillaripes]|nr:hypothetical protein B0H19DRAFT_1378969 [Mycena capillaripes]